MSGGVLHRGFNDLLENQELGMLRDWKHTVRERLARDPEFAEALKKEQSMTVEELIRALQKLPPKSEFLVLRQDSGDAFQVTAGPATAGTPKDFFSWIEIGNPYKDRAVFALSEEDIQQVEE